MEEGDEELPEVIVLRMPYAVCICVESEGGVEAPSVQLAGSRRIAIPSYSLGHYCFQMFV